ncbi:MAG: NUDIX hydrolase [Planctomycetota bacterium]
MSKSAAAIPYRRGPHGGIEVLLITRRGGGWGLPKGGVKRGDTSARTAALEAFEEAGVLGAVGELLGSFSCRKEGKRRDVEVFPLEVERVLDRWQEEGRRLRVWVPISEAPRLIRRRESHRLVIRLRHRLLTEAGQQLAQDEAPAEAPRLAAAA